MVKMRSDVSRLLGLYWDAWLDQATVPVMVWAGLVTIGGAVVIGFVVVAIGKLAGWL